MLNLWSFVYIIRSTVMMCMSRRRIQDNYRKIFALHIRQGKHSRYIHMTFMESKRGEIPTTKPLYRLSAPFYQHRHTQLYYADFERESLMTSSRKYYFISWKWKPGSLVRTEKVFETGHWANNSIEKGRKVRVHWFSSEFLPLLLCVWCGKRGPLAFNQFCPKAN